MRLVPTSLSLTMTLAVVPAFVFRTTRSFLVGAGGAAGGPRGSKAFFPAAANAAAAAAPNSNTARFLSGAPPPGGANLGPMPYPDDKMPFYALGVNLAMQVGGQGNLKTLLGEDEMEIVLQAFNDNLRGTATQDPRAVLATYGQQLNKLLEERTGNIMDRVKKDGEEYVRNFMSCNDEAVKTASGLVYCEMTPGTGKSPTLQSTVEVHYHGTLTDVSFLVRSGRRFFFLALALLSTFLSFRRISHPSFSSYFSLFITKGTVFDSSVERGQTISFPLNGVIKGWQEGLQLMKEGGKATLVIPSDLAYGDAGSGETIPPGATLKFEVELFKVE